MKSIRLALPCAALATALCVALAMAEENPVREFLNSEVKIEQPAAETPKENQQVATVSAEQPKANPQAQAAVAPAPAATANDSILALIDRYAAANGIPAAFARAVVRVESNFNPRATGAQGEVGLMQLKYQTARGIGFTGTREQLYDPATNLEWGMKYLAMSWKLGGNTPCGAVMKYQGGHGTMRPTAASNAYCAKVRAHMASNQAKQIRSR